MKYAHWTSTVASIFLFFAVVVQTCYNRVAINEGSEQFATTIEEIQDQSETLARILIEQQRARLSFRVDLDPIERPGQSGEDPILTGVRIVLPIEVGGTTEARHVRLKNYYGIGRPRQYQYISFANIDWSERDAHELNDLSPTETGRQFVADPLSQQQLAVVISPQQSLYFIARLEYCDIYGECRYFTRCTELHNRLGNRSYCGTRIGQLNDNEGNERP